jgi:alpha-glucosidase
MLRVSDHGVALRYRLIAAPGGSIMVTGEETGFRLPAAATLVASRDEGEYLFAPQSALKPVADPEPTECSDEAGLSDLPATALLPNGRCALIAESDRLAWPRAMLASTPLGLRIQLMRFPARATSPAGPGITPPLATCTLAIAQTTPWRMLVVADRATQLIERADMVPTLATPQRLADVAWIRPGRAYRIRRYTTAAAIEAIDFAVARRIDYVEFDWRWYGDGLHDDSDATRAIPAIDIPAIIAYGRARGIGLILYVDRLPAMTQLDAILARYRAWGVAGIKFGFMWEGPQPSVAFITDLVHRCGESGMIVDLHDDLRPAGLERTYPNYLTLEGVRGNEHFPTARHNVTLPFTRNAAGPMDYTICYGQDRNRTTSAHQLAMAAVFYSPLNFLYWYDEPAKFRGAQPALEFLDQCPTIWDETVALAGAIGEHVVVARRSGARWFVGAMTNEQPRSLTLPLAFLGVGAWRMRRFRDGMPGATPNATPVMVEEERVSRDTILRLRLAPSGGQALILSPHAPGAAG